jgi:hypothetical protein
MYFWNTPIKSKHKRRDHVNAHATEHRRLKDSWVVETFHEEYSLMPLLCGLLLQLIGNTVERNRLHEDVTLVHRSCVTFPCGARISQQPLHLRCLQCSKDQGHQQTRSHNRQSIYRCGQAADGTPVDFHVSLAVILFVHRTRETEMYFIWHLILPPVIIVWGISKVNFHL